MILVVYVSVAARGKWQQRFFLKKSIKTAELAA